MTIISSITVHTGAQLAAAVADLLAGLPVTVYAEEGGFPARIERGVRVLYATSADYPDGFVCIEFND